MANSDVDVDTESVPSQGSLEHDSGSENGDGVSVTEGQEPDEVERVEPLQFVPVSRRVREGSATLDSVDLVSVFKRRAHVMRSVQRRQSVKGQLMERLELFTNGTN